MILMKARADILRYDHDALFAIEHAGRTCYKSESPLNTASSIKFAQMIMNRHHESVMEHAKATVKFVVDRGVSHEDVRHRLMSLDDELNQVEQMEWNPAVSQESTRYVDYTKKGNVAFIIPPWVNVPEGEDHGMQSMPQRTPAEHLWFQFLLEAESTYNSLRDCGWKPEEARGMLPTFTKTEVVMTANMREWRHFFKMRTSPAAHPQMREVTIPLLTEFANRTPVIFDDVMAQCYVEQVGAQFAEAWLAGREQAYEEATK